MKESDLKIWSVPDPAWKQGGQHVGTCRFEVHVKHLPTGIEACCMSERSQHKNIIVAVGMVEYGLAELGWIDE